MTVNQALKILESIDEKISKSLKWTLIEIKIFCGGSFEIDIILEQEILKYTKS